MPQLRSEENFLNKVMNNLEAFYNSKDGLKYQLKYALPGLVGLSVAALYFSKVGSDNGWHRARVTKIIDMNRVEVFYIGMPRSPFECVRFEVLSNLNSNTNCARKFIDQHFWCK